MSALRTLRSYGGRRAGVGDPVLLMSERHDAREALLRVDDLRQRVQGYALGGRPSSPPVALYRALANAESDFRNASKGGCLHAGIIVAVSISQDRPYLKDLRSEEDDFEKTRWTFVDCRDIAIAGDVSTSFLDRCQAAVEAMPVGSWTWPI